MEARRQPARDAEGQQVLDVVWTNSEMTTIASLPMVGPDPCRLSPVHAAGRSVVLPGLAGHLRRRTDRGCRLTPMCLGLG